MRIGLATDFYYPWIAGPALVVRNLSTGLAARGHSIALLAPSPDGRPSKEWEGPVRVTRARTLPSPLGYRLRVSSDPLRDARRWLDAEQPDVVNIHHPFPLSAAALYAARTRGIPVLGTNHTIPACSLWGMRRLGPLYRVAHGSFGRWIVYLLNRCDAVVTPTRTAVEMLRSLGYEREVVPISNGVDTERFKPVKPDGELKRRLGLDGRPVVLYTGRLDSEKQMDVWLEAAGLLAAVQDVQLVVGGKGGDEGRLQRISRALRLENRTHFIGYLSDPQLPELYRIADVYFVTSPVELQSIGTLEAISSGLPVVAVRAGALPELVQHGENGFLVPVADPSSAAQALAALLSDNEARPQMAAKSRELALGHALAATVDAYERMLEWVVHERQGVEPGEYAAAAGR